MDGMRVAGEGAQEFSSVGIPETHSRIVAATGKQGAIGIESD